MSATSELLKEYVRLTDNTITHDADSIPLFADVAVPEAAPAKRLVISTAPGTKEEHTKTTEGAVVTLQLAVVHETPPGRGSLKVLEAIKDAVLSQIRPALNVYNLAPAGWQMLGLKVETTTLTLDTDTAQVNQLILSLTHRLKKA